MPAALPIMKLLQKNTVRKLLLPLLKVIPTALSSLPLNMKQHLQQKRIINILNQNYE